MYSGIIGSNYFTNPPEYKQSYGPVSGRKARSARYRRAARQERQNAETSTGQPDLSTLTLADQQVHRLFSEELVKKPDAVGIVELAQEVLKRLSKEMQQALPF
jgi:hypothetical protein